uniref:Band 7 domain-containing protein n=1 Tax=Oryza punctata TaxID=4537 RepID=A0A0E0LRI2_ORYPU
MGGQPITTRPPKGTKVHNSSSAKTLSPSSRPTAMLLRRSAGPALQLLRPVAAVSTTRYYSDDVSRYDAVITPPVNWGMSIVREKEAFVVERCGKYHRTLGGGIHFLVPVIDRIAYVDSLQETATRIPDFIATTKENGQIKISGILFFKRSMNEAATDWKLNFLKCLRYEIAMEMQAGA